MQFEERPNNEKPRDEKPIVLIAGPTASGKSALGLAIAREFGGVVVNADAMQVYDHLRILTARPSEQDMQAIEHALYGHIAPSQAYSVASWVKDMRQFLAHESRMPVIVGGTGLYFMAAEQGLADVPEPAADIRSHYRAMTADGLYQELLARAPDEAQRLRPSDQQRLSRALEVLESTGKSLGSFQRAAHENALLKGRCVIRIYLEPERETLYQRINMRFSQMLAEGGLEEARSLLAMGLAGQLPAMKAIGVPELAAYFAGNISLEAAEVAAQQATRHYAKRQMTWARRNMISWEFHIAQFSESILQEIFAFIRKKG